MNSKLKLTLAVAGTLALLSGCASQPCNTGNCYTEVHEVTQRDNCSTSTRNCTTVVIPDELVLNVVGYGAPRTTFESIQQRRLMALRASELDAYRKLAEQVSGVHIFGDTSVDNFIANHDRIRSRLNTFVQGATITHQEFQEDGVAVTFMSLKVSRSELRRTLERERLYHSRGHGLVPGSAVRDSLYYAPRY